MTSGKERDMMMKTGERKENEFTFIEKALMEARYFANCKIGDLVYQASYTPMSGHFVREGKIQKISMIDKGNNSIDMKLGVFHADDQTVGFIDANSIGKTVFFTEEEAKEAIELLEEQERESEPELD